MTKFENIDSIAVGVVLKALEDVVQSVLKQAYSPPLVLQDLYRFDVLVNVDSNEVAPEIGNHDDGKEIGHARMVTDVGAFDIEAACLQTSKEVSTCHLSLYISRASSALQYETRICNSDFPSLSLIIESDR